jgi:hypothetical protein
MGINRVYEDGSWSHPIAQKVERRTVTPEEQMRIPPRTKHVARDWKVMQRRHNRWGYSQANWAFGKYATEQAAITVLRKQIRTYNAMLNRDGMKGKPHDARRYWYIVQPDGSAYSPL